MKKLILVTLTALAVSWLLSEARRESSPPPLLATPHPILVYTKDMPDGRPVSIQTTPWNKADAPRLKRGPAPSPRPSTKTLPPAWFPKTEVEEEAMARADDSGSRVIVGRVSASEERARQDLRQGVERAVADWLAADVVTSWKVPANVLVAMIQGSYTQKVTRNLTAPEIEPSKSETPSPPSMEGLYTLYRAGQKLDFSPTRKARIIAMYRHDLATQRMQRLGGGLALALVSLAVLSGYIRADEATKGYYTNRLRFVAAAGLGAAGVVAYRFLV
jgi:hypothetical protein